MPQGSFLLLPPLAFLPQWTLSPQGVSPDKPSWYGWVGKGILGGRRQKLIAVWGAAWGSSRGSQPEDGVRGHSLRTESFLVWGSSGGKRSLVAAALFLWSQLSLPNTGLPCFFIKFMLNPPFSSCFCPALCHSNEEKLICACLSMRSAAKPFLPTTHSYIELILLGGHCRTGEEIEGFCSKLISIDLMIE